jgi:hypothetical protein
MLLQEATQFASWHSQNHHIRVHDCGIHRLHSHAWQAAEAFALAADLLDRVVGRGWRQPPDSQGEPRAMDCSGVDCSGAETLREWASTKYRNPDGG